MSYETVTDRIKLILQTVPNVTNIHTYLRDIPDEKKFEEAFKSDTPQGAVLSAWMMTRKSVPIERPALDANAMIDVTHNIEIQGLFGLEDQKQSELTFQKIIDDIISKFKTKFTLEDDSGVSLAGVIRVSELNVPEIGHGQFSNLFAHYCRVIISVEERI